MTQPNETHMLKAVAWDALYAGLKIENQKITKNLILIMDKLLEQTGETLADKNTWMRWGKMRKFDNDDLYLCHACNKASAKELFKPVEALGMANVAICPECGVVLVLDVANIVARSMQEADALESEKK